MTIKTLFLSATLVISSSVMASFGTGYEVITESDITDFMVLDINQDGYEDVLTSNGTNLSYYENNQQGGYNTAVLITPPQGYDNPGLRYGAYRDAYPHGDLNKNGYPEMLIGNNILSYQGQGQFSFISVAIPSHMVFPKEMADIDGDGDVDLVTISTNGAGYLHLLTNDGNMNFTSSDSIYAYGVRGFPSQEPRLTDIDNDGQLECVMQDANYWGGESWYDIVGNKFSVIPSPNRYGFTYRFIDMDSDGNTDHLYGEAIIAYQDGLYNTISKDTVANYFYPSNDTMTSINAFDFDHDCETELILSDNDSLNYYKHDNLGKWQLTATIATAPVSWEGIFFQLSSIDAGPQKDILVLTTTGINLHRSSFPIPLGLKPCGPLLTTKVKDAEHVVKIFPNPSFGKITLQINELNVNGLTLRIYDVTGQVVIDQILKSNSVNLDLSLLSEGIYFPVLTNEETGKTTTLAGIILRN
ncbi:MAG: hypothetical protein ACJAZ2_000784 [Glaciecola sp.]|jgi:hypothetical protein